ncbi:MAG: phosphotransferase, partial [Candidatus Thorarchaeota archaeon]
MLSRDHSRPKFTVDDAKRIALEHYGVDGTIQELSSERDRNFRVIADSGESYVLKISATSEERKNLEFQVSAMKHIAEKAIVRCPRVLPSTNGKDIISLDDGDGQPHFIRLLTFIDGNVFAEVNPHTTDFLEQFGQFLGNLSITLSDFGNPSAHREFYWDLKNASETIKSHKDHIEDAEKKALVEYYLDLFQTSVLPRIPELRTSIIHNDANDYNVLFDRHSDFSLLDFGDMIHSCTVFELAIAVAYAILKKPDPVAAAGDVIRGYHSVFPLTELEIELLFPMICTRLATSVSISSYQQTLEPDSDYIRITEDDAWDTLKILRDVHPNLSHYVFRDACRLTPCPTNQNIVAWLTANLNSLGPVIEAPLTTETATVIDVSIGSLDVVNPNEIDDYESFSKLVQFKLKQNSAEVGIGRYNEARLIYTSDAYETETDERRTVHLGIDLFIEPGTPVLAPLEGIVHSFQDNANPLDYGPTVILEHRFLSGRVLFYTLYGHLSRSSLEELHVGKPIKKGESFATIGDNHENGGWPPHLH